MKFHRGGFAAERICSLLAVAALWASSLAFAEPVEIPGEETTLRGAAEGMVSHRFQKHSWITPDGRYHALINTGASRSALRLFSSADGVTWVLQAELADTDRSSHPDGTLVGDRLYVAYPTRAKKLVLAVYEYRANATTWGLVKRVALPAERRSDYERPSVALDAAGRVWLSATALQKKEKFLSLFVVAGDALPRAVTVSIGLRNSWYQRSARLLQIPGGLMMVFSDDEAEDGGEYTLNFCQRQDSQPLDAAWTEPQRILRYQDEPDENGAHFSCSVDSQGTVHIVTRAFPAMYYLKIADGQLAAGTPRNLGISGSQQYPQASVDAEDRVHLFCPVGNEGREVVHVLSSEDGGASFVHGSDLVFRPNEFLGDRRVEAPANFSDALPVLMLLEPRKKDRRMAGFLFRGE